MAKLEDYASEPGKSAMDLVLFRYSMPTARQLYLHACRQAAALFSIRASMSCQLASCMFTSWSLC